MLDSLPGSPKIDETGHQRLKSYLRGIASVILPALTLAGHGPYAGCSLFN